MEQRTGIGDRVKVERLIRSQWLLRARAERDAGAQLLALWGSDERDLGAGFVVHAAFLRPGQLVILDLELAADAPLFPSLAELFACAPRMERAACDLLGLRMEGAAERVDTRPWLRHAAWSDRAPLRRDSDATLAVAAEPEHYAFVRVEGEGVHEIAVGPVHAGIIEPGHFRFSVVGEKVLRLEERLGYVHKGIEKRFEGMAAIDGQRLAARISGDSAVAYSWAYCMALESIAAVDVPPRAAALRALALERERIANHLGDLGALGNDAGFGLGLSQFMRLKENWLRDNRTVFGARYLFDYVLPGGVAGDIDADGGRRLQRAAAELESEVRELREIYDEHAGMQDRFRRAGILEPALARRLGAQGMAARASGLAQDLRVDLPVAPYDRLEPRPALAGSGDVAARVAVRFDELLESLRLCASLLSALPQGDVRQPLDGVPAGTGFGMVEGWRGPVFCALETDGLGRVRRCHPHDPSWQNWPLLEHAIMDNIVPDFPLINKSFNLSYSGHDL